MWYAHFCEKDFLQGQTVPSVTCCMKFSCFKFVHHEARAKWSQFSMSHRVRCSCKLSSSTTHFYASIRFVCTSLRTVPATCVLSLHTKWLVLASRPRNMSFSVCGPWGPIHTTPEKFENAALFLRLGLPSTLIRHENGAFRKRSSNRRNLKTPALCFSVDERHFEDETFRKR